MLIDSHAHLEDPRFDEDRDSVIERSWKAGVHTILTIGNGKGPDDMGCGIPLAQAIDWVFTTVGVHPHDANLMETDHLKLMEDLARNPYVLAIGEAGLDYHYDNSPREIQREVFRSQVQLAKRLRLPVIVHTRDADRDTIQILTEEAPSRGVIHCFTGEQELADCALDLGLMISFSGILTFKGATKLRAIAERCPSDRILIETDSPYLAPVPHRGKRNEPTFLKCTAESLALIRGVKFEQLAEETCRNFADLFEIE